MGTPAVQPSPITNADDNAVEGDANIDIPVNPEYLRSIERDRLMGQAQPGDNFNYCTDALDLNEVRKKLLGVIKEDTTHQTWGQCAKSAAILAGKVYEALEGYKAEIEIHYKHYSPNNSPMVSGHAFVYVKVCGEEYLVDNVGGSQPGPLLGLGIHTLDPFTSILQLVYGTPDERDTVTSNNPIAESDYSSHLRNAQDISSASQGEAISRMLEDRKNPTSTTTNGGWDIPNLSNWLPALNPFD